MRARTTTDISKIIDAKLGEGGYNVLSVSTSEEAGLALKMLVENGVLVTEMRQLDNPFQDLFEDNFDHHARAQDQKHIFEPLFTTKRGGLGLGLYFVRMAVESRGGTVSFDSKLGYGTTFKIILCSNSYLFQFHAYYSQSTGTMEEKFLHVR